VQRCSKRTQPDDARGRAADGAVGLVVEDPVDAAGLAGETGYGTATNAAALMEKNNRPRIRQANTDGLVGLQQQSKTGVPTQ